MDYRNTQMDMEDRTKAPGGQPSPGLSSTGKRTDAEPITSGASQVVFPDAEVTGGGKQPPFALGGPEKAPGHAGASEEWPLEELGTHEQRLPASSGKKQLSWTAQEGPWELQAGHDQFPLPSAVLEGPVVPGQQQAPGHLGVEAHLGTGRAFPTLTSCLQQGLEYPSPGHQAADGSDMVQPTESSCPLDSCGQPLGDDAPKKAGVPHIRPGEAAPELSAGDLEDGSQEAMLLVPLTPAEEDTANPILPSTPGPKTPKEGDSVPAAGLPDSLPCPQEVRDIGEKRELYLVKKQLQEPEETAGAQSSGNVWQGFMKCLLEVEEEEATHRRTSKARGALTTRKPPKTLSPVCTSAPALSPGLCFLSCWSSSPSASLPLWLLFPSLLPPPHRAIAMTPSVLASPPPPMAIGGGPAPRWQHPVLGRQELEEHNLLTLYQSCEARPEEHLTQKQEEAFRSYFEIFNGPGEVDAQSLKNILLLVGFSLTPAQVEDVLMSADVDGDGHVDFKDFLAVMTDSKRFFCSVEQNALANMAPPNPHTLLFEILSLLVEMLALPEAALEEITNYYQKKLKDGTCKVREMDSAIGRLRSRKKLPYNPQQADSFEISERKVLRILSRIKQQNYAANLQSPYAQVPCIPLCPRMDKKMVRRKQGNHYVLDQCASSSLSPDIRSLFFPSGPQGSR
uniref:EF-hand domain-containing protein n=1 Tax=Spermophilus dauricus TaxID=99837 RepID=A0A8C9Q3K0_SPEDA